MPTQTPAVNRFTYRTELYELISRLGGEPYFIEEEDFERGHRYFVSVLEAVRAEAFRDGQLEGSSHGF